MKVAKFTLSGKTAFFKKPEVNAYCYFSYGHIHKVAILGIFGAILGYSGYNQMKKEDCYPEFYSKLHSLKVSIIPFSSNGCITKKIQWFNNSVGYASREQGGNLIVKEQWLENPRWDIYLQIDCMESEEIVRRLLERQSIYTLYLGKNDHLATISDVKVFEDVEQLKEVTKIDSLFPKEGISLDLDDEEEEYPFVYNEMLPIQLEEHTNQYILNYFIYTNTKINSCTKPVFKVGEKQIIFY